MLDISKRLDVQHNVTINVIDVKTGTIVHSHEGHNASTNSMLIGIANYLIGAGSSGQSSQLERFIPKYISLGTMGLYNQSYYEDTLYPGGIGIDASLSELENYSEYMKQCPGFGADGYDPNENNGRGGDSSSGRMLYLGLGPTYANREDLTTTVNCELITDAYKRSDITYRNVVPEYQSTIPQTVDVVFSAYISTGALAQFRVPGSDYIFITEAGLWSRPTWTDAGVNGLLAGYRIAPPDEDNWKMAEYDEETGTYSDSEECQRNRRLLRESIIRVGKNQIVQVVWKVQLGGLAQIGNINELYPSSPSLDWIWM